eukprot:RCo020147
MTSTTAKALRALALLSVPLLLAPTAGAAVCPDLAAIGTGVDVSQCTSRATGSSCSVPCVPGYQGTTATYTCSLVNAQPTWTGTPPSCSLIPVPGGGVVNQVPQSSFLVGSACNGYNPASVNWNAVHNAFITYFGRSGTISPNTVNISFARVASLSVRVAFHDAGAYSSGVGGADGSAMLSQTEQQWDGNRVPFPFLPYVRAALTTVVPTYGISWADGVVMAGVAGTHFMGGNINFTVTLGRCDNSATNPPVLPGSGLTYQQAAVYWNSVGISLVDAAALLGSHSTIVAPAGDPPNWSNELFVAQMSGGLTIKNASATFGPAGVQWTNGHGRVWKYTVNDAYNAPSLLNPSCTPAPSACPFLSQFLSATQQFASSNSQWNVAYGQAYDRMTRIGAQWAPSPVSKTFPINPPNY